MRATRDAYVKFMGRRLVLGLLLVCTGLIAHGLMSRGVDDPGVALAQGQTFTLAVHVTEPPAGTGTPIADVTLTLHVNGALHATGQTNSNGDFTFTNVPGGVTYDVTPTKTGFTFNPVSQGGTNLNQNRNLFFTGQMSAPSPTPTPTPSPTPSPSPSVTTVQFSMGLFSVNESGPAATITVTRTGDISGMTTVEYGVTSSIDYAPCANVTGVAAQNCDYAIATGTLIFSAGQTMKDFLVLITNDVYAEGNETLTLGLSQPTGGSLGNPASATLTILDDDSGTPTANPSDQAEFFVRQHYYDLLARLPDDGGLAFWTSQITSCNSSDAECISRRRVVVSNAFFYEQEYQRTASYVFRLYRVAYGDDQPSPNPDSTNVVEAKKIPSYAAFVRDRARVIDGPDLAQLQLAMANLMAQRPEFVSRYPLALTGPQFVDALLATIQTASGANLTSQRDALITLFNQGGRGMVLYRLADDNVQTNPIDNRSFIDAEYNRAFVYTEYAGYLRRDSDIGGFLFWLGQVDRFPLRDTTIQHAMVCSFITSSEYQQRFSSVVTHSNQECDQ